MKEHLEVGDYCQFSCNGPTMCVVEIVELKGQTLHRCGWFDCRQQYHTANFPLLSLVKLFMFSFQCQAEEDKAAEAEEGDDE